MNQLADYRNLLSKVTRSRASNAAKVLSSYYYSRWNKKATHKGMPVSISVEPTTSCNLRCPECPSGLRSFTRPTGKLKEEPFRELINELHDTLLYLTFYFQGEPYLHPQFLSMVEYAASKNIYTSTSTNAHYLSEENARATVASGLDRLIISIDGTTQDTYASYRVGGSLEKVIEGTKNILQARKELKSLTPHVVFQFLVVRPNEHQVEEVKELAAELGVDRVAFKTAQIYDFQKGSPLMPTKPEFSRYRELEDGTFAIKNELSDNCWKMWHSCVVTWDGKVVPCCFDKDAHHVLGELKDLSFEEIWKGNRYNEFRSSLLRSRSEIEMCRNCSEGTRVWA